MKQLMKHLLKVGLYGVAGMAIGVALNAVLGNTNWPLASLGAACAIFVYIAATLLTLRKA